MLVSAGQRVSLFSYVAFVFGSARAIRSILAARGVFPLAVLLTISAGFAREYDGEYLSAEPWYVGVPLVVALGMGTVLWLVLRLSSRRFLPSGMSANRAYLPFLTCYLLTAPLAWLYAVPYERMFNEFDAMRCNLWTLSAVSVWRVLLITRVASVLFGRHFLAMLAPVLLFASSAVVIGLAANFRLPEVMGGVRMSDVEQLMLETTNRWFTLAFFTWPVCAVGTLIAATAKPGAGASVAVEPRGATPGAVWIAVTVASVLVWGLFLAGPQREQRLRYEVEQLFARSEIDAGLRLLSSHEQAEFPPHWKPPPLGYREFPKLTIVDVVQHFSETEPPDWVREPYFDKLTRVLSAPRGAYLIGDDEWPSLVEALRRLPEGPQVAREAFQGIQYRADDERIGACVSELLELARVAAAAR